MQKSEEHESKPTVESVKNQWQMLGDSYSEMDSCPQTFFYTLANMLKLDQAKNILEIAAGTGRLIPMAFDLKHPDANYFATDISDKMLSLLKARLEKHLQKYQSELTLEAWMQKTNLKVYEVNGEEPLKEQIPSESEQTLRSFDRIIANMVVMLTPDATKMLRNLADHSIKGCLFGLSVWGEKVLNNFHPQFEEISKEKGFPEPEKSRSNFYLYNKVGQLAEQTGWEVVLKWDQNGILPNMDSEETRPYAHHSTSKMSHLSPEQQKDLEDTFISRLQQIIGSKKALNFPAQCYILRKK